MPGEKKYTFLPRRELLSFEEIARVAGVFADLGVRKVRLTGGEPLLRRDLPELVRQLRAVESLEDLALTTNGSRLEELAEPLREAGLDRVTVSLESLDEATFARINGVGGGVERVVAGIEAARRAGLHPVKVNVVVIRGVNDHEIVPIARFFKERSCVVRFIEYMDVGTVNGWERADVFPASRIVERLRAELPLVPAARERPSSTALRWRYEDDGLEVGVVASITRPFCGACTRARLSAEGRLYRCLFATTGVDLKEILRSGADDEAVRDFARSWWRGRDDRYSEERLELASRGAVAAEPRVEMFRIGG